MRLSDRLERLERHAPQQQKRTVLTADHWLLFAKRDAAIIVHWLGGTAEDVWERLYAGIAAGNASGDAASAFRYPLKRRFDWAANHSAGYAATGRVNSSNREAWRLIHCDDKRRLLSALEDLGRRHPDLIGPEAEYPPVWRISDDGALQDSAGNEVVGLPIEAFGIDAVRFAGAHV